MKTLAIFNQKGGVGKTSLSFHLAWYFAELGRRTLIVDLDPQGNMSSLFDASGCLTGTIFAQGQVPTPVLADRPLPRGGSRRFGLITADESLQALEATTNGLSGLTKLRKALRSLESQYDIAVIDCPPSLGGFSANAIVAADHVVIPCTVRQFSINGLEHVCEVVSTTRDEGLNPTVDILAVVLNQFNRDAKRKTVFERDIWAEVEGKWGSLVLNSSIPTSIKIEEALYSKLPVWEYAVSSRDDSARTAGQAYRCVVADLVARMDAQNQKKEGEAA